MLRSRYIDIFILFGLVCCIALLHLSPERWGDYLPAIGLLCIQVLPVAFYYWYRERITRHHLLYWLLCVPAGLAACLTGLLLFVHVPPYPTMVVLTAWSAMGLDIVLMLTYRSQRTGGAVKWWQQLSLERGIFLIMTAIALLISAMAVSSLGNPDYTEEHQQLIGMTLNRQVFTRFGTFLLFFLQFMVMYGCGYLFFYINSRLLVTRVLKDGGMVLYALSVLATICVLYPVMSQLVISLPINTLFGQILSANPFYTENGFFALIIMLVSLPVILTVQWSRQNNRINALEKEKARTELDLLKQQLNPHFFFNTLNNLYALSLQRSEQAPESIMQLSELMRYVIYKGQEERVTVGEELQYIEDYMRLQQIRLKHTPDIVFIRPTGELSLPIAPMLLIILVENAFKHGIEPGNKAAWLRMELQCTAQRLYFVVENSFDEQPEVAGIGLQNLQQRLALLYPNKHSFRTDIKNHTFKAALEIDLS